MKNIDKILQYLYAEAGADAWFDAPFFRVANADDPWFERFKTLIGDFHWTPQEALSRVAPGAKARSVIVWILPATEAVRHANRFERDAPARLWSDMRTFGEMANEKIAAGLARTLSDAGFPSVAPHLEQLKSGFKVGTLDYASHWSERHVAWMAGLGTFGLHASLITERGSAMRVGSVVTELALEANVRPYGDDPFAWCTRCGACIERCPAGAVGERFEDRDKARCGALGLEFFHRRRALDPSYNGVPGCGLCQTGVPCEFKRP